MIPIINDIFIKYINNTLALNRECKMINGGHLSKYHSTYYSSLPCCSILKEVNISKYI